MLFPTVILSLFACTVSFVSAAPASFNEQDLYARTDGDVNVFAGREITTEEIVARDAIIPLGATSSIEVRDYFSDEGIQDIAVRYTAGLDGDMELEPRVVGTILEITAKVVNAIFNAVKGRIEHDKAERGKFTSHFVTEASKRKGNYNWMIIHTPHSCNFEGTRGKDWGHEHKEFNVSYGKTIGYEIYWGRKGVCVNKGDGGYLNWAMSGKFKRTGKDEKTVNFY
ncbi:hypothetical protein DFP72DRAFT_900143 [Ephemerocybe angulata]|uniref:Uncharacterized protein n=1 Tax=Ephemerocybe angulata TaxID=980116 RepID=A0A8H6HY80_9AGAR|nr:hypothetical protein DFP72DRAFT_900143 [Tulosesus angulatus]